MPNCPHIHTVTYSQRIYGKKSERVVFKRCVYCGEQLPVDESVQTNKEANS